MALPLIIITGLSGAGRTTALKALEDQGYQTVDNLPLLMVPSFIDHILEIKPQAPVAVGLKTIDFSIPQAEMLLKNLQGNPAIHLRIIYLECNEEQILQRYNESRRPHPIEAQHLSTAITIEKLQLSPLKKHAEMRLDTSDLTVRHLRQILQHYFFEQQEQNLKIQLISFSYKHGIPKVADLVLDMRFLSNPFYDMHLRPLSGKNQEVQTYIKQDVRWMIVDYHFKEFLINAIHGYREQGRFYLNIAFGCTGGQHRSVFVTEFFHHILCKLDYDCLIEHRDLRTEII